MLDRVSTNKMVITPEIAAKWLHSNEKNRVKSQSVVREYARAMKESRWRLNGETIKLSPDGRLIDGQHRLQACVDSQCAFESYVVTGVDPDAFDTVDIGKKRSAGDIIGIDGVKNATSTASAVKWICAIREGLWHIGSIRMPADETRLFLAAEPGVEASVQAIMVSRSIIAPGMAGALHYLFSEKDEDAADKFFNDLGRGTNLAQGDAVLLLREKLIKERMNKTRLPQPEIAALCIRAWARRRGDNDRTTVLKGSILGHDGKRRLPSII